MGAGIRGAVLAVLRHFPALRLRVRRLVNARKTRAFAAFSAGVDVEPRTVVFCSYMGRSYSCSPRALYEQMKADPRFDGWRFIWLLDHDALEASTELPALSSRAELVEYGSAEHRQVLAAAGFWVTNSRSPEEFVPKEDQRYVQCWHGTPLKRLGYDLPQGTKSALNSLAEYRMRYDIEAAKWDYLVSPSPYATECLLSAFGLAAGGSRPRVLELGYPRNDAVVAVCADAATARDVRSRVLAGFGIEEERKVLLYAPTFRDDAYDPAVGYVNEGLVDLDALRRELGEGWAVLFRPHYFVASTFDFERHAGFVYDASGVADIADLYPAADALLTDYSSVMFDYSCTGRPLLFYMPDERHYADEVRGFYLDVDELPGPRCTTPQEVASHLADLEALRSGYDQAYRAFRRKFCPDDDGMAAKRVVEAAFA